MPFVGATAALGEAAADLMRAWRNEKSAPTLLPFAARAVVALKAAVAERQRELDAGGRRGWSLQLQSWYQLDCDRVKFVLNSYRRARLFKIQKWFFHLAADAGARGALSPAELEFFEGYKQLRLRHLGTAVLSHLPEEFQRLGSFATGTGAVADAGAGAGVGADDVSELDADLERQLAQGPNPHKYMPFFVRRDLGPVVLEGRQDPTDLAMGSMIVTPFSSMRILLRAGDVECR